MSDNNTPVDTNEVSVDLTTKPSNVAQLDQREDLDATESDDGVSETSSTDSEFETVDLAESELYQVLSLFLNRTPAEDDDEDTPSENVTDVLSGLKDSVDRLNNILTTLVTQNTRAPSSALRRHKVRSTNH